MTDNEPTIKVLPIPPGSILWLHNIDVYDEDDAGPDGLFLSLLQQAVGHKQFAVLKTDGGGIVDVVGAEELVDRVRAVLEPSPVGTCDECGRPCFDKVTLWTVDERPMDSRPICGGTFRPLDWDAESTGNPEGEPDAQPD